MNARRSQTAGLVSTRVAQHLRAAKLIVCGLAGGRHATGQSLAPPGGLRATSELDCGLDVIR